MGKSSNTGDSLFEAAQLLCDDPLDLRVAQVAEAEERMRVKPSR
jgi:hypothetical protein